jgi:xanthine dehydrogenase YagR molybdenum-binding subunit
MRNCQCRRAGVAAAITDAVHHATGIRVRELPVRIEHLLA